MLKNNPRRNVPVGGTWEPWKEMVNFRKKRIHLFLRSAQGINEPPRGILSLGETSQKMKMGKDQAKFVTSSRFYLYLQAWSIGSGSPEHFIKRDCEVISRLSRNVCVDWLVMSDMGKDKESDASLQMLLSQWLWSYPCSTAVERLSHSWQVPSLPCYFQSGRGFPREQSFKHVVVLCLHSSRRLPCWNISGASLIRWKFRPVVPVQPPLHTFLAESSTPFALPSFTREKAGQEAVVPLSCSTQGLNCQPLPLLPQRSQDFKHTKMSCTS